QNNNTKFLQETVKAVGKVRADLAKGKTCGAAADDDTSFLLGRLEQKVDSLTSAVETLVQQQAVSNRLNEKVVDALTKLVQAPGAEPKQPEPPTPPKAPSDGFGMVV
ncbi:MAG: hypothetical protein PHI29_13145, partial [Gallionella sp.]|nr:hypothetical protein [Gallionella sp.]